MSEVEARAKDRAKLIHEFYSSFDRSLAESFLSLQSEELRIDRGEFLGQGRHFSAYLLKGRSRVGGLVIKIPGADFGPHLQRDWISTLSFVAKLNLDLIPPFELIQQGSVVALAMPYGSEKESAAGANWQPLTTAKLKLESTLKSYQIAIDDYLQIRCFEGIPFVCDLSDLKRSSASLT